MRDITNDGLADGKAPSAPERVDSMLEIIGSCPGIITDPADDLFSTGEEWEANRVSRAPRLKRPPPDPPRNR